MEEELTDAEKHASYINLIETIGCLSRGDELSDDWFDAQMRHVQLIRRTYPDMGLVNLERQDTYFRNIANQLEVYLRAIVTEIDVFGTLDTETYLLFCQSALKLMDMVEEDDELADAFANLLR